MDKKKCISISQEPISVQRSYDFVVDKSCGGISMFVGTVRNNNLGNQVEKLEFECYEAMALKVLQAIVDEATDKYNVVHTSVIHRIGIVLLTEVAVVIAVSTKHRKEAFLATEYIIDELKKRVPIWKKEFLTNGSYWVNARP